MTRFFSRFYAPILFGMLAIALTIFSPILIPKSQNLDLELGISVGVLGFKVPLSTWIENAVLVRVIAFAVGLAFIAFGLLIDFSRYFPERLKVDVYFDHKGIARTLRQFTSTDLKDLEPPEDWQDQIQNYDEGVVLALNTLWTQRKTSNTPPIENIGRDFLHAVGETQLVVCRTSPLRYKIIQGGGQMSLTVEARNRTTFKFQSAFYLRETRANYLRPLISELIRSPSIILRPEFKQVFQIEHGGADAPFDHVLVALTKISLVPAPSFSDTLYLWRNSNGKFIPVGYAIYSSPGVNPEVRGTSF